MYSMVINWLDVIWLPVVFFMVQPRLRWIAIGFVTCCILMLRMQYELLKEFDLEKEGVPGLLKSNPFHRGLITYSIMILLYVLLTVFSQRTRPEVYLAASITIFIITFAISSIVVSL